MAGSQPTSSASASASSTGTAKDRRPTTILGVAIGVPFGILSIAGLSYLFLRQHRKIKALKHQSEDTGALPPEDAKTPPDTAELDAHSSAFVELDGGTAPSDTKPSDKARSDAHSGPPAELDSNVASSKLDGSVIGSTCPPAIASISEMQGSTVPTPGAHHTVASSMNLQVASNSQQRHGFAQGPSSHQSSENDISRPVSFQLPADEAPEARHPNGET